MKNCPNCQTELVENETSKNCPKCSYSFAIHKSTAKGNKYVQTVGYCQVMPRSVI